MVHRCAAGSEIEPNYASADHISGLDPQELDRLLLPKRTACQNFDALADAGVRDVIFH